MRVEFHIVLDSGTLLYWIKRKWARLFGKPQYVDGQLWGHKWGNTSYLI